MTSTSLGFTISFTIISLLLSITHTAQPEGENKAWNQTWTDTLKRDLLHNYDKFARPAQHTNATKVTLDLTFRHIHLDDVKSMMTVNAWVQLTWKDEKLKWDINAYGGLNKLHLADHEIWEPDIVLYNSAVGNNIDHYGNTHCLAWPDGTVLWVPPSQFSVFCDLDLSKWPFDTHMCVFRLGSWTYSGEQIDLQTNESKEVEVKLDSSEWSVVSITKKRNILYYSCCAEPYIDIMFNVTVERLSSAYHSIVVNPAIALVLMTLSVFWLPPHSGHKFLMSSITALLICLFLIYFSKRLPFMGINTPLIVLFYSNSLILVAVSLVMSVVTYNLANSYHEKPVPWFIGNLINGRLNSILLLPNFKSRSERPTGEEMSDRHFDEDRLHEERGFISRGQSKDWLHLAVAIDRLLFALYLLIFAALAVRTLA